jgi:hypothetical protein
VRSRFETPKSHWPRVAPAVAADSAMLTAYFIGRIVGLTALWRSSRTRSPMDRGAPSKAAR